jgi:hypothetical protein
MFENAVHFQGYAEHSVLESSRNAIAADATTTTLAVAAIGGSSLDPGRA